MASNPPPAAEGEAPSKNGLKKAQKEKEKAEKKAKKAQVQQGESSQVPIHDTASQLYGGKVSQNAPETGTFLNVLYDIEKEAESSTITFIAQVQSSRKPSAKLAFLVLGQYEHTIQAVAAEGGGQGISRQMVKWCAGISNQSIVRVTATVFKPKDPVISCSISKLEAHILSIYMISEAAQPLPVQPKDCNQPPLRDEEEPEQEEAGKEGKDLANVSLKARLDNRVLSMRPPSQVAIMKINEAVYDLFGEFMKGRGFTYMVSPSFAGAATEGGAGVFEVKYFDTKAYLTQSPQFYKQIAIAGGAGPVYLVGPVFRAENSNTKRHLTEVRIANLSHPQHILSPLKLTKNPSTVHRPRLRIAHPRTLPRSPHPGRRAHHLLNPLSPNPPGLYLLDVHPPCSRLHRSRQLPAPPGWHRCSPHLIRRSQNPPLRIRLRHRPGSARRHRHGARKSARRPNPPQTLHAFLQH